jgi:hypothetical protein
MGCGGGPDLGILGPQPTGLTVPGDGSVSRAMRALFDLSGPNCLGFVGGAQSRRDPPIAQASDR